MSGFSGPVDDDEDLAKEFGIYLWIMLGLFIIGIILGSIPNVNSILHIF